MHGLQCFLLAAGSYCYLNWKASGFQTNGGTVAMADYTPNNPNGGRPSDQAKMAGLADARQEERGPPSCCAPSASIEKPKPVPTRVLLVEDDEDYRQIVDDELSWHGFTVRSFADGKSLLSSLEVAADVDVSVLDWR